MPVNWDCYSAVPDQEQVYGHVDEETFWAAVLDGRFMPYEEPLYRAMFGTPYHTHVRVVAADEHLRSDGFEQQYHFDCRSGRGAAAVTVARIKDGTTYRDQNQ